MSNCPRCGVRVAGATKIWPVHTEGNNTGNDPPLFAGAFQCPACKNRFIARISTDVKTTRTANVKNKADRIMRIQGALMQTIKTLKEKIATLESEKSSLMGEIETLRKAAEARVSVLEAEVGQMREEAKNLRELINNEPTVVIPPPVNSGPS